MDVLAKQLRQLMDREGIRQTEVAEGTGASQSTVARWLSGSGIRATHRERLARYLVDHGVAVGDELTADTTEHSPETQIASTADRLGNGLAPVALRLSELVAGGIDAGPARTEAGAALDKLLARVSEFAQAVEQLRDELVE